MDGPVRHRLRPSLTAVFALLVAGGASLVPLLAAGSAGAQDKRAPRTSTASDGMTGVVGDPATVKFVDTAAMTSRFEIKTGKLALEKSSDPKVRSFAETTIRDHQRMADELRKAIAASKPMLSQPRGVLDAKHRALFNQMEKASGAAFDRLYVSAQRAGCKEVVTLFKGYAQAGHNASLKAFAAETLPTLEHHLEGARQLPAP